MPEDKRIGLFLDHIPRNLNPAVRFDSGWSPEPTWIVREDVQQELSNLVEATLKRAQSRASGEWATFVRARWAEKRAQAADEESRRSLLLGRFVSERWQTIKSAFGEGSSGIHSLLIDAEQVTSQEELRPILDLAPPVEATRKLRQWALVAGAAHDQGYELAAQARAFLGNQAEPVSDLPSTLREFDVELRDVPSNSFFSAVFSHGAGASILAVGTSPRKFGIAPTRFAIAAALGRLLAERTTDGPFGAAHSSQSRWINTQRANAFAAEFLLPVEAIGVDSSVETLCDAYGISRSAAAWHVHNRRRI
ncbi:MAG: hypothetical protein KAI47_28435 [Deltaproteobacteria bacterium]|nr:hypothetical protein [Deltaproteobacteria bacterium]